MSRRTKVLFLILVLVQGLHSVEEFIGKLWESFPPAAFLCSLVSENLSIGYLIINIGLFVFGILCWIFQVRKDYSYSNILIWFWIVLELINGIGHPTWTIVQMEYSPGIITAPILLLIAIDLLREQLISNKV